MLDRLTDAPASDGADSLLPPALEGDLLPPADGDAPLVPSGN